MTLRKRGLYGNGTIAPSGRNSWRLRYRVNGQRFSKTVCGTRTAAAKELRRILKMADDGIHVVPQKITFAQWTERWLKLKERSVEPQTLNRYEEILTRYVVPKIGSKLLQKVSDNDIEALYGDLKLAPGSMAFLHVVLKSCLTSAVRKKLIISNPANDVEKPAKAPEGSGTVLDEEQLAVVVVGFKGTSIFSIVATAAFTGMRKGEVLALRWVDIDFDKKTISITRSMQQPKVRGKDGVVRKVRSVKKPKTDRSIRIIQVDDGLLDLLRSERDRYRRLHAGLLDGEELDPSMQLPPEALCFPAIGMNVTTLRSQHSVYELFVSRAAKLGFDMRFHDLRGTHSTILLDKGVPVHVVAARIGDDPATLLRSYAKRTKKADTSAAEIISTITKGVLT